MQLRERRPKRADLPAAHQQKQKNAGKDRRNRVPAGYSQQEADAFSSVLMQRISVLTDL